MSRLGSDKRRRPAGGRPASPPSGPCGRRVGEVLKQLAPLPHDGGAAAAIRSLLGESDASTSADELAWAFRKTLERAATEQPLVVVLDDIQWGDEPLLDLVEHVTLFSAGV